MSTQEGTGIRALQAWIVGYMHTPASELNDEPETEPDPTKDAERTEEEASTTADNASKDDENEEETDPPSLPPPPQDDT